MISFFFPNYFKLKKKNPRLREETEIVAISLGIFTDLPAYTVQHSPHKQQKYGQEFNNSEICSRSPPPRPTFFFFHFSPLLPNGKEANKSENLFSTSTWHAFNNNAKDTLKQNKAKPYAE